MTYCRVSQTKRAWSGVASRLVESELAKIAGILEQRRQEVVLRFATL